MIVAIYHSCNRLFEPTYRMYESFMSIQTMLPKMFCKTLVCLKINIFHYHWSHLDDFCDALAITPALEVNEEHLGLHSEVHLLGHALGRGFFDF